MTSSSEGCTEPNDQLLASFELIEARNYESLPLDGRALPSASDFTRFSAIVPQEVPTDH